MCGGKGYLVRTPEELAKATEEGFKATVPVVVNVIIEAGQAQKLVSHSSLCRSLIFKHTVVWLNVIVGVVADTGEGVCVAE
jgi:hypothetical protein